MSLSSIWNTVYPILIAILFFELIIIVHEGGHFVAARLMKIKVNEFSIGMGPKIFSFTKGDTKYSLRWILSGGYCAMEGEDEDSDESGSFSKKSVPARMFVVVAGAVMNLILGFLIIVLSYAVKILSARRPSQNLTIMPSAPQADFRQGTRSKA